MDSIFAPTQQAKFWIEQTGYPCQITDDFAGWISSPDRCVAIIDVLDFNHQSHSLLYRCCQHADLVFIVITELISDHYCQEFDLPNVVFVLSGRLNWQPKHARTIDGMYFFWSTCDFYRRFPHLLQDLDGTKSLDFDVLLGRPKLHRDWIYHGIDRSRNRVTYFPHDDADIRAYGAAHFEWPSEVLAKPQQEIRYTVQEVLVDGVIVSLSQIIPRTIYQQTKYSLVAETQNENSFSFFTEKITKPILARRVFLVASGQHYLKNLRDLGFQTFDDIIDESYDHEPCAQTRMDLLLREVDRLQKADHEEIAHRAQEILSHNFDVMMHTDWQHNMIANIRTCVSRR